MAVTVAELFDGLTLTRGLNGGASVPYLVYGTTDPIEAETELIAQTPGSFDCLTKVDGTVEPLTLNAWRGTVRFGNVPPEGATIISFDTTGGVQHITQSLETVGSYAPVGETAPDFHGAIGVSKDAVEGADIVVPVLNFSVIKSLPASSLTFA
jgi:hypothetical protein